MKVKLILLIFSIATIHSKDVSAQWSKEKAVKAVNEWINENEKGLTLDLKPTEHWKIQCPIGIVCDENYDYRMFTMKVGGNNFTLSFSPELATGITLEKLNSLVKYFTMHYSPIDLSEHGWEVRARLKNGVKRSQISFSSWKDSLAIMHLDWSFDQFELTNMHDKECLESYQIMDASTKEGCIKRIKAEIPVKIIISAKMENLRVKDNRNVDW